MKLLQKKSGVFESHKILKDNIGHCCVMCSPLEFRPLFKWLMLMTAIALIWMSSAGAGDFERDIRTLSAFGDRSTGTSGCRSAAEYIKGQFQEAGFSDVGVHRYSLPILQQGKSLMAIPDRNMAIPLHPLLGNAISPQAIDPQGLRGQLVYVGAGALTEFNGKSIEGAILLMLSLIHISEPTRPY